MNRDDLNPKDAQLGDGVRLDAHRALAHEDSQPLALLRRHSAFARQSRRHRIPALARGCSGSRRRRAASHAPPSCTPLRPQRVLLPQRLADTAVLARRGSRVPAPRTRHLGCAPAAAVASARGEARLPPEVQPQAALEHAAPPRARRRAPVECAEVVREDLTCALTRAHHKHRIRAGCRCRVLVSKRVTGRERRRTGGAGRALELDDLVLDLLQGVCDEAPLRELFEHGLHPVRKPPLPLLRLCLRLRFFPFASRRRTRPLDLV